MKRISIVLGIALLMTGCNLNHSTKENKIVKEEENQKERPPQATGVYKQEYFSAVADSGTIATEKTDNGLSADQNKPPVVAAPQPQPDWDKKIIKNGSLGLEIKDYRKFTLALREKIKSTGGYIAQEEQNQNDFQIGNNMTVKVPVDQFDNAMQLFSADAEKVNEKKISTDDVTRQYIDTKTRMDSKKAVLQRYTELLKQAKNMEEILNVQNEINAIQEELESAGGEAEYLKHASAFSTITISYTEVLDPAAAGKANKEEGNRLAHAFRTGWNGITAVCIELLTIWPLLLAAAAAFIILKRRTVKKAVAVS